MANTLTGDFDVVAQFGVLTVDRLLAGMHQTGRFSHGRRCHLFTPRRARQSRALEL